MNRGAILRKIERVHEERRDDATAFEQEATLLLKYEELTPSDRELALERIRALTENLPVKLGSSAELTEATAVCAETARRLKACAGYGVLRQTWPAPIAHEVYQLVRVLEGEGREASPEAALLQLRDICETLLKLPASILACRVLELGGDDALAMRRRLTDVRGGLWYEVARSAAEQILHVEPSGMLATLAQLFMPGAAYGDALQALGQARNTYLGHGAMRSNPRETAHIVQWVATSQPGEHPPARDMERRPTLLDAIESGTAARLWANLRLEAIAEDGTAFDLTGDTALVSWLDDPRHVTHHHRGLRVRLVHEEGTLALELGPLVAARICRECGRRDVFFFDAVYDRKPWKSDFLDYARGHKSRFKEDESGDLRAVLLTVPEQDVPPPILKSSLQSGAAITGLDRLRVDKRYVSPKYLREPIARFLERHKCGTYWLQAPAHVGKTTLVLGLTESSLQDSAITPTLSSGCGGGIAAFLCKREYRGGVRAFLNGLSDELKTALDLRRDLNAQFPELREVTEAPDKRQAFVEWLDHWRILAKRADRALLVIIDGLDEADPPSGGDSLLDLLPKVSDVSQGLYFLLTSRPISDDDCPPWLGPAVEGLADEARRVNLDDRDYHTLLTDYVCKELDPTNARRTEIVALSERLISQAEGRFAFLSFLVEQLKGRKALPETIGALGTGQTMYDRFIDTLEARYGAKRGDTLLDVLATVAALELAHTWTFGAGSVPDEATGGILEPLPRVWPGVALDVLATATDLDERSDEQTVLTVPFVEALILLQSTLWVWRGEERDVHYRLGLKEFAERLAVKRPEAIGRAYRRLVELCLDQVESLSQEPSDPRDVSAEGAFRALFPVLPALVALSDDERSRERFRDLPVIDAANAVEASREEAGSRRRIAWLDGMLMAVVHGAGPPRDGRHRHNDLAGAYSNRGAAKGDAPGHGFGAAVADCDYAIILLEALLRDAPSDEWPLLCRNNLAKAYITRGAAKWAAPGHGFAAAIADFDQAIALQDELRDALKDKWPLPSRNVLANAYVNRGIAKQDRPGHGPAAAIADYDEAIVLQKTLRDALKDKWPPRWANDLAFAYMNRGTAKQAAPGHGATAAIADYDHAIELYEALRDALKDRWPLNWSNGLAAAYVNRGNAKQASPGYSSAAAIADFDRAIALQEAVRDELNDEWPTPWRNNLAVAKLSRGAAKESAPGHGPASAIADYDHAIALQEALRAALKDTWPLPWRNDLAHAYSNRGNAKQRSPGHGSAAAIADYDRAIALHEALRDALKDEWPLPWRNDLARIYVNRGNAKQATPDHGFLVAIADYDNAINLREALRKALNDEWPLPWRNDLAGVYMNRGNAKQAAPGHGSAAATADYDHAIALLTAVQLDQRGRHLLVQVFRNCAVGETAPRNHELCT